jgi:serine/threonine-protein kinase
MSQMLGTPHYMSPEQTQGSRNCDATTDQYALGVLLYECTTGRMPFDANELYTLMLAINKGTHAPARTHRPELPEDFDVLLTRALGKRPVDRYPDILAFARALLPLAGPSTRARWTPVFEPGSQASVPPPSDTPTPSLSPRSHLATLVEGRAPSLRPDPRAEIDADETQQDDNLELAIDEVLRSAQRPPMAPSFPRVGAPTVPGDLREPEVRPPPKAREAPPPPAASVPHPSPPAASVPQVPPSAPPGAPMSEAPSAAPVVPTEGSSLSLTPAVAAMPALRPPPSAPPRGTGGLLVPALVGALVGLAVLGGIGWALFRW